MRGLRTSGRTRCPVAVRYARRLAFTFVVLAMVVAAAAFVAIHVIQTPETNESGRAAPNGLMSRWQAVDAGGRPTRFADVGRGLKTTKSLEGQRHDAESSRSAESGSGRPLPSAETAAQNSTQNLFWDASRCRGRSTAYGCPRNHDR